MAAVSSANVRNLVFCGHGTCGKTTLVETLLLEAGAIERAGNIAEGTTVCDSDEQEKESQHSIDLACAHLSRGDVDMYLIDTPGYRDFIGQVYCGSQAVECMVVVVDADEGVRPNTRKVWQIAEESSLPCVIVISRCDREHAKVEETLAQIREQLSAKAAPLTWPNAPGPALESVERTLAADGASERAKELGENLLETVVESSDELMERYLGGDALKPEEIDKQLVEAVGSRAVFPVLFTACTKDRIGVPEVLETLLKYAPPANHSIGRTMYELEKGHEPQEGDPVPVPLTENDPFTAMVFKIVADPYVGKLSYLRIFSGQLAQNGTFTHPRTGKTEKAGKIIRMQGKEQESVDVAGAGSIVALVKLEGLETFDIITADKRMVGNFVKLPTPMFSRAVSPKSKADEKKFAESIHKVIEEDVLIASQRDNRTGELVVSGTSALHLQVVWERLKSRYGVEVDTKEPKTPYLETISAKAEDHYRHKKQTGGAGEFGEVWLRVEPLERGSGLQFVKSVFGGAISDTYVGSAEKGIRQVAEQGVIAGYPVVDVKVDIFDGKEHPVDSKDIAFQKAGREAFKLAMGKAKPVLLEPIVDLEVTFPTDSMGEIQGDLNRRRGRVVGMEAAGDFQTLKAQVPLAELSDYASSLGSVTGGQGTYGIEMSHYEEVPSNVQQKICEQSKAELQKEASG